jgi:uncharacterized protein (TIGR02231 family)
VVSSFEAPAKAELLCAPERFPAPALVARFENRGAHVLLAGPVELVRGSGFVGRSQVKFAAVGEEVRLAFGGDDDLRVAREPSEQREESRLTGKRTTRHHVRLFVSNVSGKPARLAVEERIPVSEIKEVEVQLLAKQTEPKPANVTKDGIVRFELELAPREHRLLTLAYQVEAAAKVVGL